MAGVSISPPWHKRPIKNRFSDRAKPWLKIAFLVAGGRLPLQGTKLINSISNSLAGMESFKKLPLFRSSFSRNSPASIRPLDLHRALLELYMDALRVPVAELTADTTIFATRSTREVGGVKSKLMPL